MRCIRQYRPRLSKTRLPWTVSLSLWRKISSQTAPAMRTLISFAALFLSVILLQLSSGAVGPLDALSGLTLDFTKTDVGLLGSAHFLGFFIGCWWAPRLMGSIGHSRAFAAFTATGAIGLLGHMLIIDP